MDINAELIKTKRTSQNWTQQHLADACGVSLRTIQRVERYGNASSETVMALASVFEIQQSEIIVPENPVIEMELIADGSSKKLEKVVQFIVTLSTGMLIGAGLVVLFVKDVA
ncbi:helix-turn-helix domain-containing protein [Psychrosphaera aestuarii]|uniref:helix-turn-helix domain-containing protein n=1 Tax=Psychrosphaera aestuarii TaxID=1266052 RepID=UPI001B34217F|nr:helix-turn-helix transcriptional regulator [Psychrosphaera aestuarii]